MSAAAYPSFSSWRSEREVRNATTKIKNLFTNIYSQVQNGSFAFVQVEVTNEFGDSFDCQPNELTIIQGVKPGNATLAYHFGVELLSAQVLSANPIMILIFTPIFFKYLYPFLNNYLELDK